MPKLRNLIFIVCLSYVNLLIRSQNIHEVIRPNLRELLQIWVHKQSEHAIRCDDLIVYSYAYTCLGLFMLSYAYTCLSLHVMFTKESTCNEVQMMISSVTTFIVYIWRMCASIRFISTICSNTENQEPIGNYYCQINKILLFNTYCFLSSMSIKPLAYLIT